MIDITDEMIAEARKAFKAAGDAGADSERAWREALETAGALIYIEQVAPVEQALADSEQQVAELGRNLHAALARVAELREGSDAHADRLSNGAYER